MKDEFSSEGESLCVVVMRLCVMVQTFSLCRGYGFVGVAPREKCHLFGVKKAGVWYDGQAR